MTITMTQESVFQVKGYAAFSGPTAMFVVVYCFVTVFFPDEKHVILRWLK